MGLRELAEECGVTTSHVDGLGRDIAASEASMLAILRSLGIPIQSAQDADTIRDAKKQEAAPLVAPCHALSEGQACILRLVGKPGDEIEVTLTLESGESRTLADRFAKDDNTSTSADLNLGTLPVGYHHALVRSGAQEALCHLLVAPCKAFGAPGQTKSWGIFAPLYALRGANDYGVGDFSCLANLMDWASELGASFVGTLPLLAANYREDFQSSPYSPVSRLFWNELYLDIEALATRYPSPALAKLRASDTFSSEACELSEDSWVDYARASRLRRSLLQCIAQSAWQLDGDRLQALAKSQPELHRYVCFRAATEKHETTWPKWPTAAAQGKLAESDYDEEVYRYHLFCQWALDEQLQAMATKPCDLYLDLSVGVSGSSFDVWRYQDDFVSGVDVGAPPDGLFEGGQNWALPPLHPERSRKNGHEYFRSCVRAHMRHAGMLRIDHVMGLHRLYWVPSALGAGEGLYVRYPAEELYAILLIESQRQECILVGEDLGTVPDSVRPAMEKAGIHRLYVGQFSTVWREAENFLGLQTPSDTAVASLDTHDTQTFAGWFDTTDLTIDPERLMRAWSEELAAGPAAALVITLEDLWLEPEPQNRPGTGPEQPNWRHRIERPLAEITADIELASWLGHLSALRSAAQNC